MANPFDAHHNRGFHRRIAVAGTGGVFADGFGLGIIGIALTLAAPQLHLDPVWLGLIGGASLAGLFAGALIAGPLADRHGRRPIFAYNMVIAAPLAAAQFFVRSAPELLLLRLSIGFLLGTDYVVSKALLTEFAPGHLRGRTLGVLSIAWAGGYACAYAVGYALTPQGADAWRLMLLISALPCLAVVPLRLTLPESPRWLAKHRATRHDASAHGTAAQGSGTLSRPGSAAPRGRWHQLFDSRWRVRTLLGCAFFTCQVIPYFAVGTFVAQIMGALNLHGGYAGGLIYNAALLTGAGAGLWLVDRIPRRVFLIGSFWVAALSLTVLILWRDVPLAAMILLFALFACVLSAASNLCYVYLPELFPTDLRASGIGISIAASRVGSALGTFLLPVIVSAYGVRAALWAYVFVLVAGAMICQRWAPETRSLSLLALDAPDHH